MFSTYIFMLLVRKRMKYGFIVWCGVYTERSAVQHQNTLTTQSVEASGRERERDSHTYLYIIIISHPNDGYKFCS